jgi:gluconate:H+ symporter, GntP family
VRACFRAIGQPLDADPDAHDRRSARAGAAEGFELPPLWLSLLPVLLPVLLISSNTIVETSAKTLLRQELIEAGIERPTDEQLTRLLRSPEQIADPAAQRWARLSGATNVFGNANFRPVAVGPDRRGHPGRPAPLVAAGDGAAVETALMSGGVIILITAAGGAFGAMLQAAQVGPAIQQLFAGVGGAGIVMLCWDSGSPRFSRRPRAPARWP